MARGSHIYRAGLASVTGIQLGSIGASHVELVLLQRGWNELLLNAWLESRDPAASRGIFLWYGKDSERAG